MSEKWYFNETLLGLKPANDVRFDIGLVTREQRCIGIVLPSSFYGMMYDVESGKDIVAFSTSWGDPAYRTIELDEPATGELLTFLQQNATNLSSGPVDPTPVKLINKVVLGSDTVLDLTSDTVTPETLLVGTTAHNAKGETIVGTLVPCVTYSATSPEIQASENNEFTWQIAAAAHGFSSSDLFVSVYLSNGEQIFCDVVVSLTDYSVTITAFYVSDIQTLAVPSAPTVPAGYLKVVIMGPATTPAAVQQAMLNQLPVYTGGGNY